MSTGYISEDVAIVKNKYSAARYPHCGTVLLDSDGSLPVEVSNVEMKFGTMIWFLIKVSFAAVPAGIVIYAP